MPTPDRAASHRGYALVVPGLAPIASDELTAAGAVVTGVLPPRDRRDDIVLFRARDLRRVLRCGTVEDVFAVVADVTFDARPRAAELARAINAPAFERALALHHQLRPKRAGRSYKVVARASGRQPFRREDLRGACAAAVARLLPRWRERGDAAVELWAHAAGPRFICGVRLSDDTLAGRRYKRAHLSASLKPTVARALVLLAGVEAGDVVIDPMCGAGTIVRERADAGRADIILGGEIDAEALEAARVNVGRAGSLARWDAIRLPLRQCSVDALITNPPYGRRHDGGPTMPRLYASMLREAARVLRPDGRCVVLTGEPAIFQRAVPPALSIRERLRMTLRGLPVTAFVLTRL